MDLKEKLYKIDLDFENGLRFKATNRLRNLIQENPNEIQLWNKLAEFYYESGFLDAAGKYWILTETTDERIKKCVEIYEKSVNYSGNQILQEIVFRGDKSRLSKFAQQKLTDLEIDSEKKAKYVPKYNPKHNIQKKYYTKEKETFKDKLIGKLFFFVLIIIVFSIIVGLITITKWIFGK
jgi:hypothetical protein